MGENVELEKKYRIDPSRVELFFGFMRSSNPFDGFTSGEDVVCTPIVDRYFDTDDCSLAKRRLGLRTRAKTEEGGDTSYSLVLKSEKSPGDLVERVEVEVPICFDDLEDISRIDRSLLPLVRVREIVGDGVFVHRLRVHNRRNTCVFYREGIALGVSLDDVTYFSPDLRYKSEIEVEVEVLDSGKYPLEVSKDDARGYLDSFGRGLMRVFGLVPNTDSKYLRGLRAIGVEP